MTDSSDKTQAEKLARRMADECWDKAQFRLALLPFATMLVQMGEAMIDARERTVCRLTPWLYSRDCGCEPCTAHREYAVLVSAYEALMKEGE